MTFDPLNLLLLAVALVVFWRLRSVLGTRTGAERPPLDPLGTSRKGDAPKTAAEANGNVVRFPQNENAPTPAEIEAGAPAPPLWTGFAEAGSDVAGGLEKIAAADPAFTPASFVEGAKMAYEMIIDAFARGDKAALRNLLSKEVLDGFSRAIDEREAAGHRVESRFVGIDKATIDAANLTGSRASVTMRFVSEMISATFGKSGDVADGDPREIREITDVWTFERDVTSRNPNWKLVATQEPA